MSTVTKIVDRPADAPKAPIYPRLVTNKDKSRIYWVTGPGRAQGVSTGILLHVEKTIYGGDSDLTKFETPGFHSDNIINDLMMDFTGAVTLYNK